MLSAEELARAREIANAVMPREEILELCSVIGAGDARITPRSRSGRRRARHYGWCAPPKGIACLEGRNFVLPEDVQAVIVPTLRHRIVLEPSAEVEGMNADAVVEEVVRSVPVPH